MSENHYEVGAWLRGRFRRAGRRAGRRGLPDLTHASGDPTLQWLQRTIRASVEQALSRAHSALEPLDRDIAEAHAEFEQMSAAVEPLPSLAPDASPAERRLHAEAEDALRRAQRELARLRMRLDERLAARASLDRAHRRAARKQAEALSALAAVYWAANLGARPEVPAALGELPMPEVPKVLDHPLPGPLDPPWEED
jgi:hypothetical protein